MLTITIPKSEYYDELTNLFIAYGEKTIQLEHSLVSISKWESKWKKPFLFGEDKTYEETIDYIRCMTITQNVDSKAYDHLSNSNINDVKQYIESSMTATTIRKDNTGGNKEVITSEIIYYWMIALDIPFECQKWHFSRLITLINVCNIKKSPSKKLSKGEIMSRNKALNDMRRRKNHTTG